jgi:hypothetical protein
MGETRVDLVHLLGDLRDAYPGSLEETILTEIVANALDSGARTLRFLPNAPSATLAAVDDGAGMTRRELSRYHDIATTTKRRGRGIGFAGVGIKLGLLACEEVVTETRRGRQHIATRWRLTNRSRAPWSWTEPPHLVEETGTAVSLRLANPLSQLLEPGFIEATVLRHFQPLFEPEFIDILAPAYPEGLTIAIDERVVVGPIRTSDRVPIAIRLGRQRRPSAVGYLARHGDPLPEQERGLAISTLGKVIRRGWDWLDLSPADGERIEGLIEVPALAEALTLNKGDFLRTGPRGALFLSFRKAIQETVATQLAAWGESREPRRRTPRTRPLERDLHRVLGEMAAEFPLLATLAERRSGGQKRLPLGEAGNGAAGTWPGELALRGETDPTGASGRDPEAGGAEPAGVSSQAVGAMSGGNGGAGGVNAGGVTDPTSHSDDPRGEPAQSEAPGDAESASSPSRGGSSEAALPGRSRSKKRTRLSLEVRFESRPGDDRLGRLIETTVWVNDAHPAYRRAVASRAEGYHLALTVAAALAPLTVEPARGQDFVNAFLARWGESAGATEAP